MRLGGSIAMSWERINQDLRLCHANDARPSRRTMTVVTVPSASFAVPLTRTVVF